MPDDLTRLRWRPAGYRPVRARQNRWIVGHPPVLPIAFAPHPGEPEYCEGIAFETHHSQLWFTTSYIFATTSRHPPAPNSGMVVIDGPHDRPVRLHTWGHADAEEGTSDARAACGRSRTA